MIRTGAWSRYSIWEHSAEVLELYTKRARGEAEEMTCHAQAAEILAAYSSPGDTLADIGCGSGYFLHSLKSRNIPLKYTGCDACEPFILAGKSAFTAKGIDPSHLVHARIEDLELEVDHAICINVLSNIDNFHRPLERMLLGARKSVLLRESFAENGSYFYVKDKFLDPDVNLKVHVNTYSQSEVEAFVRSYGFEPEWIIDRYTGGAPQLVIDYPHHWKFLLAKRKGG